MKGWDSRTAAAEAPAATQAVPRDLKAACPQRELGEVMLGRVHEALNVAANWLPALLRSISLVLQE